MANSKAWLTIRVLGIMGVSGRYSLHGDFSFLMAAGIQWMDRGPSSCDGGFRIFGWLAGFLVFLLDFCDCSGSFFFTFISLSSL